MAAPQFVSTDVAAIVTAMVADYEAAVGRTLQPAQAERLLINMFAYREGLVRAAIQDAAEQNLVEFSRAPALDYLGQLVGVTRLAASAAELDITFTLVPGHTGVTIPAGLRVTTTDGKVIFRTKEDTNVNAGVTTAVVLCECDTPGTAGNGYTVGTITNILDPQPYLVSATNAGQSAGGADAEDDTALRRRIQLAPGQFSNAGSESAYRYWAFTANPGIIDVAVVSPHPGEVNVYPLMEDGNTTPTQVLDAVNAAVNSEKVRPLTDLVLVLSPDRITYSLNVQLQVYDTADNATVEAAATAALEAFTLAKRQRLGQDVIGSAVIASATVDGVYKVTLVGFTDVIVTPTEFAACTSITVSITASVPG